mmetsp:Transcript_6830/g.14246  ORF Transcript_6830/g.14246 Transcript_6830/m.14246 type:complete len:309 (-) Transcript_6830:190-1116(-)
MYHQSRAESAESPLGEVHLFTVKLRPVTPNLNTNGDGVGRIKSSDWVIPIIKEDIEDISSVTMKALLDIPLPMDVEESQRIPSSELMKEEDMHKLNKSAADVPMDAKKSSKTQLQASTTLKRVPLARFLSDKSSDWAGDFSREQAAPLQVRPSLFDEKEDSGRRFLVAPPSLAASAIPLVTPTKPAEAAENSSTKASKRKNRSERILGHDICVPTENDVLFGRGGFINSHPGNVSYRKKVLQFRPVYERSTKEGKFDISRELLEAVTSDGARFLQRGEDGEWHRVIGNGARRKVSQALREKKKGSSSR